MKRKTKLYSRPKKLYEKERIEEENVLVRKYALKNKHEIWKCLAKVRYFRHRAKELAKLPIDEQKILFDKLNKIGLKAASIADVLSLKAEDLLERRLPTIVFKKGLASTPKHARQMVVHGKIIVDKNVVNIPSYIVPVDEENKISIKLKQKKSVQPSQAENLELSEKSESPEKAQEKQEKTGAE